MISISIVFFIFSSAFLILCYLTRAIVRGNDSDEETDNIKRNPLLVQSDNINNNVNMNSSVLTLTPIQLKVLIEERVREILNSQQIITQETVPASNIGASSKITNENNNINITSQNTMHSASVTKGIEVAHVSFKPPQPLYTQNPEVWFVILEQQFQVANIKTEHTKYSHAVSALDSRLHNQFASLITRDKGHTPYTIFKKEIIRGLGESERAKLHNLLHGLSLGDKKPSQLLEQLKLNAGNQFEENSPIIKQLWMQRLPSQVQMVLTPFENDMELTILAERADNLIETMSHTQIQAVTKPENFFPEISTSQNYTTNSNNQTNFSELLSIFKKDLLAEVSTLINTSQRRTNSSDRSSGNRSRDRSSSKGRSYESNECYYHRRFGDKASKCVSGCKHHTTFVMKSNESNDSKN